MLTAKLIDESRHDGVSVLCLVHVNETDEWTSLHSTPSGDDERFVMCLLDFYKTPNTVRKAPSGKSKVTKRLVSVEMKINNHSKMFDLYQSRDAALRARSDACHQNIHSQIEYKYH